MAHGLDTFIRMGELVRVTSIDGKHDLVPLEELLAWLRARQAPIELNDGSVRLRDDLGQDRGEAENAGGSSTVMAVDRNKAVG